MSDTLNNQKELTTAPDTLDLKNCQDSFSFVHSEQKLRP